MIDSSHIHGFYLERQRRSITLRKSISSRFNRIVFPNLKKSIWPKPIVYGSTFFECTIDSVRTHRSKHRLWQLITTLTDAALNVRHCGDDGGVALPVRRRATDGRALRRWRPHGWARYRRHQVLMSKEKVFWFVIFNRHLQSINYWKYSLGDWLDRLVRNKRIKSIFCSVYYLYDNLL